MLATTCGYEFDYIDNEMDIPRITALMTYWKLVPPPGVTLSMIRSGLGITLPEPPSLDSAKAEAELFNRANRG